MAQDLRETWRVRIRVQPPTHHPRVPFDTPSNQENAAENESHGEGVPPAQLDRRQQHGWHRGDDHDQHILFIEHQVPPVEAVASFARQVVDDRVTLDACAVKDVGGQILVFATQDDLQLLQRAEIEVFHVSMGSLSVVFRLADSGWLSHSSLS